MGKRSVGFALLITFVLLFSSPKSVRAATCTWSGASGNWNLATNWSCNAVPGTADSVVIATNVVVIQDANIDVSSLTISAGALVTGSYTTKIGTLNLQGGAIAGTSPIAISAAMNWSGGNLGTSGTTTVGNNLTLSGTLVLSNNGILDLQKQGAGPAVVTWNQATTPGSLSGTGTFSTVGAFTKSGGGAVVISGVTFSNSGAIAVSAGSLEIPISSATFNGPFSVAAGATLTLNGTHTFDDNTNENITGAGTVEFKGGTATFTNTKTDAYNVTGGTTLSGSGTTLNMSAAAFALTSLGANLNQSGGTFNLGSKNIAVDNYSFSGGTLSGSGTLTVNTSLNLSGTLVLTGRTLTSAAATTWSAAGSLTGSGTLNASGTLVKDSAGLSTINVSTFTNSSDVTVSTGILEMTLASGSTGTYAVSNAATLRFLNGHTFAAGATITGTGTAAVEFRAGTTALNSTYNVTGTTLISGANVTIPAANLTNLGTTLTITSGSLDIGSFTNSLTTLNLGPSGTLTGTGTLTVGTLVWSGGTLQGTGGTTAVTSAENLSGTLVLSDHALSTTAPATWTAAGSLTGTGSWTNSGALLKSSSGTSTINLLNGAIPNFSNTGAVSVTDGILEINISAASHGPYTVALGKTLRFTGSHDFGDAANENISGGIVEFNAGTVNLNNTQAGAYNVTGGTLISGAAVNVADTATVTALGGSLAISSGSLNLGTHSTAVASFILSGGSFSGTGTLSTATLAWSGGTQSGSGTTSVSGSTDLSGLLTLTDRILATAGTVTWSAAGSLTGTGIWNHSGALNKSSPGTSSVALLNSGSATFKNLGAVSVSDGILELNISSASSGSYTVDLNKTLRFTGGHDFTLPVAQAISGAGTVEFSAGTINLANGYGGLGQTVVSGAAVTVNQPAPSTGPFRMSDGTLRFAGSHVFTAGDTITVTGSSATVEFASGTIAIQAAYNVNGITTVSGAAVTLDPLALTQLGSILNITAGSLDLGTASPGVPTFNLGGNGSLSGSGTLTATTMAWSGGTMQGLGLTTVTGSLNLSGTLLLNRSLSVPVGGTATWIGAGTLNGTGAWSSDGSLIKNSPGDSSVSLGNFALTGGVSVSDGRLSLNLATFGTVTGTYSATAAGILRFTGSHYFTPLAILSGNGILEFVTGPFSVAGTYNFTGETSVNGTLILTDTGAGSNGPYTLLSGSVTFSGNHTLGSGATFSGAGSVAFTGGATSLSGSYAILGTTTISGATLNFNSASTQTGPFVVNGTLNLNGNKSFGSGAPISGNGTVAFQSGSIQINGVYNLSGTTTVSGSAVVDMSAATITSLGGTLTVSSGSLLLGAKDVTVNAMTLSGTGLLSGTGVLNAANLTWSGGSMEGGGTTRVSSSLSCSGNLVLSNRTLQVASGTALWMVGTSQTNTLSGTGTFINSGTLAKNGQGTLTISVSTFRNSGSVQVINGVLEISPTADSLGGYAVFGTSLLRFMTALNFNLAVSLSGTSGTIDFSGAGTTDINGPYNFTGLTQVHNGAVNWHAASLSSGPISAATPNAVVKFLNDRAFPLGADLDGTGTVEFASGNIVIDSLLNMNSGSGATVVSGALVSINNISAAPGFGATLSISSGALTLASGIAPSVSTLNLSGGTLNSPDPLSVTAFAWSGGVLAGSGSTTAVTGLSLSGNLVLGDTHSLTFTNSANTNPNMSGAGTLSGSGSFTNAGSLVKNDAGTFTFSVNQFNQTGTIDVSAGILNIQPAGVLPTSHTGSYTVTSPGTIRFSGSHIFSAGGFSGSGAIAFDGGVFAVSTSYDLSGSTTVNGAVTIQYPTPSVHTTGPFLVTSGTLSFLGGHIFDSGADFSGAGLVEFNSGVYTINSAYSLSGETRVMDLVTINYPASAPASSGIFTVVAGTLTFTGGHTFAPGTLISGSGVVDFASGTYTLNGGYTLTGDTRVNGTVAINYPAPAAASTGKMIVNGALALAGDHTFQPGADISGTGTLEFKSGAIAVKGIYNVTGATTISGATLSLANATLTSLGTSLTLAGGSLLFGTQDASVTNLTWSSGVMAGSGGTTTVTSSGQLQFLGSDPLILSTRTLTNGGAATWNRSSVDGYLFLANGASLVNDAAATFTVQASGSYVFNGTGSWINNGIFNKINTDAAVIAGISLINNGSGAGKGINVNGGSLEIGSFANTKSTSTGSYQVAGVASLIFSGYGTHDFTATSTIGGAGNVEFRSGSQTFHGTVDISGSTLVSGAVILMSPPAALTHLGSTLTISAGKLQLNTGSPVTINNLNLTGGELTGGDAVTIAAHLGWSNGMLSGAGATLVDGSADFSGTQMLTLDQRRLTINSGKTAQWNSSAYLYLTNGAVFEILGGAAFVVNPTSTYVFHGTGECLNSGTLTLYGGILHLEKFTQTATGMTKIIVKGPLAGSDYGQIQTSTAQLAGELQVSGASGFTPTLNVMDLMTYITQPTQSFNTITLAVPFDKWEKFFLVDRLKISTPTLKTYIPMINRQP